jgi:subtilisin family serine protease
MRRDAGWATSLMNRQGLHRKGRGWPLAIIAACGLACVGAAKADEVEPGGAKFVEQPGVMEFTGQLIVRPWQMGEWRAMGLNENELAAARVKAAAALANNTVVYYPEVDDYVVSVPAGMDENTYSGQLMATGLYQYAEPNWRCFPIGAPNDPLFGQQWHHVNMRSVQAWDTPGGPGLGSQSVIVAVTDTGIDVNHPDLAANRVPGYHAPSDTPEVLGGPINDINGHGTHVAGCAAAVGNNAVGVAGTAPNVKVMMCRVTDASNGGAALNELTESARWAIDNGAKSASTSYSGVSSGSIQTTGEYIKSKGGVYLYAAGNDGSYWSNFDHQDVIVVGASNPADDRTGWSGYGPGVDLFAPGEGILASVNGGGYEAWSGTSMATPVANGVVGLLFSQNANFTPQQIETLLFKGCKDLGEPGNDDIYGWGRADSLGSVQLAIQAGSPIAPEASDDLVETLKGVQAAIDVLANDADFNGDAIFIDQFQTQTQQGGTVQRLVGTGPGGRDELLFTPKPGYVGSDAFVYIVKDSTGLSDVGTVLITVEDPAVYRDPENPPNAKPGVKVSYYELSNPVNLPDFGLLTPYKTETVKAVGYQSTLGNFATSDRADEVGAVFEGYVNVGLIAEYTFYTSSDDGSKLWVGDQLIVNNDGLHGMEEKSGKIKLKPGRHQVRIEFFENGGGAGLLASISAPGVAKKVIPSFNWWYVEDQPPACYADCDASGTLSIDDFICFQSVYALGDPQADCDQNGQLGIDDFICFQTLFALGC